MPQLSSEGFLFKKNQHLWDMGNMDDEDNS